jgi:hypothetical protein
MTLNIILVLLLIVSGVMHAITFDRLLTLFRRLDNASTRIAATHAHLIAALDKTEGTP